MLGGFQVSVGLRTIEEGAWRLRKAANLVKLLALAPGYRMHQERAMDLLWPDLGRRAAANNLSQALHAARRAFEADPKATTRYLDSRGGQLLLCPEGELWVDVEAFEEAAATARRVREPAAHRAALELYAGELLPGDPYEDWAEGRREGLRRLFLSLLVELAGLHEERGEYAAAVEAFRRAVAEEPTYEEAHVGLMRLYALLERRRDALDQYGQLEEVLSRELAAEPDVPSRRLYEEIASGRFPQAPPSPASYGPGEAAGKHNLPAARTSFVGRERERAEVKRALSMTRLLSLTGAGGSGKTRLALEVARDLVGAYPDGVWLVELAAISDPALVPQAVARTLDVREQPGLPLTATLVDALRHKQMLLVLDNCEHLIDACARFLDTLLSSCSRSRVLATSREALGVAGEANWPVPLLTVPGAHHLSATESLTRYEAVYLFADRARSKLAAFGLNQQNAGAVADICRRLDGIPLAIELAAARVTVLAVEQIAERLEDSLKLLTAGGRTAPPRHRTLRATLEWSYDLLSEQERALFGRLSVFAGGWTLEAAEEVCSGEGIERDDVLDLLSKLVDKSLVVAEASPGAEGELRYRMLEPVRQYGQERLEESGTAERLRERHAQYYLALAEEADREEEDREEAQPELWRARPVAWLEQMVTEQGNLRAALSWSLDEDAEEPDGGRAELGLRLAATLSWFWYTHDYLTEGRRYLERTVSSSRRSDPTTTRLRARALNGAGTIAIAQGDFGAAKALTEEGLALYRELGDEEGIAAALTALGVVALWGQRNDVPVRAVIEELGELKPRLKNRNTLAYLLLLEGVIALSQGDLEHSVALHEQSLKLFREIQGTTGITACLSHLGGIALVRGDYERAVPLLREPLRLAWESDYKFLIPFCLFVLACVAASREQPVRAARLWGAVEGMEEAYGVPISPIALSLSDYEGRLSTARSQLEEEAWLGAWEEGKTSPLERVIEYTLSEEEEREPPTTLVPVAEQPPPPADERAGTLTRREREVALLLGRGLTNRRIAEELAISEHTAATHVRNILKKLGLDSRTRIAAWVMDRQPLP
jgi:predicted ATPase/DNA-binding SARP family transcriptional activator/DNA-binding CsgD family transcriptional regulator